MNIKNIVILSLIVTLSCGCSVRNPQERLKNRGYSYTEESFVKAVKSGDLETAKLFLDAGMSVNSAEASSPYGGTSRSTVLHIAIASGQPRIARFLIDNGANVNVRDDRGRQPLFTASLLGTKEIVELLVNHGAEINPSEKDSPNIPLHAALRRGHYEIAKYLISKGADVLVVSQSGYTALHAACESGNPQIVELAISPNSNLNAKDKTGVTPLRLAAQAHDSVEIAAILIKHGADVNIPDEDGRTALNWAVTMHHTKTVELLLQHGADVNIVDNLGMTALHWAVLRDGKSNQKQLASYRIVQLLLSKGARSDVVDKQGRTPLTIARREEIISLLQRHH